MTAHLQRAWLLYSQSRYDLAEQELRQELAGDPANAEAHALLALCLVERKEYQPATEEAQAAVHLAPDLPFAHSALSRVYAERNRFPEAAAAVHEALRLDPSSVQDYALLAQVQFNLGDWAKALLAASQGLEIDPEHVGCNNLRAMALVKLGRKEEAGLTIESTLARDPEDAYSHANMGWTLLEQRQPKKALESFQEALRLDPELAWARAGIVEALKARHFIYRVMLIYFLWMAKLGGSSQWAIVIGGYVGYRVLGSLAEQNPDLRPWVNPLLIAYVVFAILTWIAAPLFDLLLRLNRFGRLALSPDQITASNWIGAILVLMLAALAGWAATRHVMALEIALVLFVHLIPVKAVFSCDPGWPRQVMAAFTLGLVALSTTVLYLEAVQSKGFGPMFNVWLVGVFLSPLVANGLMTARVRY